MRLNTNMSDIGWKVKGQPWTSILCPNPLSHRFNKPRKYICYSFNSYRLIVNTLGIRFNLDHHLSKLSWVHIPKDTYKDPRSLAITFWLQRGCALSGRGDHQDHMNKWSFLHSKESPCWIGSLVPEKIFVDRRRQTDDRCIDVCNPSKFLIELLLYHRSSMTRTRNIGSSLFYINTLHIHTTYRV